MGNGNCNRCDKCKCNNCEIEEKNVADNLIDKYSNIIKNDSYESFNEEINKNIFEENNQNKAIQISKVLDNEKNTTNNNQEIITDNKKEKEKIEIDNTNSINNNDKNETINNIIYNDKENKNEEKKEKLKSEKENFDGGGERNKSENVNPNKNSNKVIELVSIKKEKIVNKEEIKDENSNTKSRINKSRNDIEEFDIVNNDLVYISNKNNNVEDNTEINNISNNDNNENIEKGVNNIKIDINNNEIKINNYYTDKDSKNISNINKVIDIFSIIPKSKILKLNDNSIICNSMLEKIIKIPEKNKIIYNERFCVLTKKNFSYYKSKESYLNLAKPFYSIDLKNIKKVEQTILDDTSYYFGLICTINDDTKDLIDKINTFINLDDNNSKEFLLGFRSKNKDLIIKWIVILNYFIENYE